ncbi:MAG: hypothetical protein ACPGVT_14365, partial [Maricaulaceae bacterium]
MTTLQTLQRAHAAFEEKKYDVAETLTLEVLDADPKAHKAHQLLSFIARERGDWGKAEAELVKALEIDP